ncbi:MAG: hypothetical protein V1809_01635 [Planctomycetota bacterium]
MNESVFARETRRVEFIARHLWRVIRPAVARHLSRRCRNCVLPEGVSPLDATGLCGECRKFADSPPPPRPASEGVSDPVDELLRSTEGKAAGVYDAILLVSGGKDSAWLLHRITTGHPRLRLLTVLVDNGFMSPIALANAARVMSRFDVDHLTVRPRPAVVRKAFRTAFLNLHRQTGYSIVDLTDGQIIFDTAKHLAARMGIPMVLCGLSRAQIENGMTGVRWEFPREREAAGMNNITGIPFGEFFTPDEMTLWFDGSKHPPDRIPRFVFPLYVWEPAEEHILREVSRLGLLDAKRTSPLLTNNRLIPLIGIAEVLRFGHTGFEVEFARNVREGKSAREYWLNIFEMLEYSAKTGRFISGSVDATLAELGLSRKDIGLPA